MKGLSDAFTNHSEIRGVDLVDLCDRFGTPLFVFDENLLRENYRSIHDAFEMHYPNSLIAYSIKTNYNLAICEILRDEGAYADVATGLDLFVARKAGFPFQRIILDGLRLSETELCDTLEGRVLIVNVETFSELQRLNRLAGEMGTKQDIGIRVNLTKKKSFFRGVFDNEAIQGYPSSRFGFSLEDAYTAFKQASKLENLNVVGIMTHPYRGAKTILPLVDQIRKELGTKIRFLNIGGGFSKKRRVIQISDLVKDFVRQRLGFSSKLDKEGRSADLRAIAASIAKPVKQKLNDMPNLVLEPGRYIVGDAGLLLLRVECIKMAFGHKWIITNGGTNLIPDYWERREIRIANRHNAQPTGIVNVVGPLLYPNDFIAIKKRLPNAQEGDILAVYDVGAYTLSQSTQFLYPRPATVLLGPDGEITQIREKETYADVLSKDMKA